MRNKIVITLAGIAAAAGMTFGALSIIGDAQPVHSNHVTASIIGDAHHVNPDSIIGD